LILLALDLSSHTGWACGDTATGEPEFGTFDLPKTGTDVGRFAQAFDAWLRTTLEIKQPHRVVFETPILPRLTQIATVRKLTGLAWHTEFVCRQIGVSCAEADIQSIKKFFTGNGRADKAAMIRAARRYGWRVSDDNQADACALWAYAVHEIDPANSQRFKLGPIGAAA
jgi:crossover junction endodeoxyribonuclease RuvC